MKKIVVLIFCVLTFITVKADNPTLVLDCEKEEIYTDEKVLCDLKINFSDYEITNISFDYETNLNLSFIENNNTIVKDNSSINISYQEALKNGNSTIVLKIEGTSTNPINSSIQIKNIKVNNDISLNNIVKNVVVKERRVLSSNASLTDITIDRVSIDGFNSTKYRYDNIIVNNPIIFIDIKGKDEKATVTGVGSSILKENTPTEINIQVVAEDKTTNTYTLVVTYKKEQEKSNDATLSSIELYNGNEKIDFAYNKDETSFKIKVDGKISRISVRATLNNEKASFIDGYAPNSYNLDYGNNVIEIKTKSENGDTKIYKINVERDDNRNTDNTLSVLKINDIDIKLEKNKFKYEVNVDNDVIKTDIYAKAKEDTSKVEYKDINLSEGNNDLIIKVSAENGKTQEYRINVIRKEKDSTDLEKEKEDEVNLQNIKIEGYSFSFQKDNYEYDLNIDKDVDKLNIIIEPKDADVEILNNKNLMDNSTVIIRVKEKEEFKSYTINIHKEKSSSNNILFYGLLGLGLILIGTSVVIFLKKEK